MNSNFYQQKDSNFFLTPIDIHYEEESYFFSKNPHMGKSILCNFLDSSNSCDMDNNSTDGESEVNKSSISMNMEKLKISEVLASGWEMSAQKIKENTKHKLALLVKLQKSSQKPYKHLKN
jgi:hypothetical protein